MTGFTHEYLQLISYYSRTQKCTIGVTREYFNSSVIAHELRIPRVTRGQRVSYL